VKLLLATTSRGKLREQRAALARLHHVELVALDEWGAPLEPPDEPGPTFRDNAARKALYYNCATGLAALAEDAGLVVDALDGRPGIESSRWLGPETSYERKNAHLVELLVAVPWERRTARYVSAVALAIDGAIAFEHLATCEGLIALEPGGDGGFGYDPVFFYPPLGRRFSEVPPDEKNRVSHRGKAMRALERYLEAGPPPPRARPS
jgi:XTP/dITP diphosphohydrolase